MSSSSSIPVRVARWFSKITNRMIVTVLIGVCSIGFLGFEGISGLRQSSDIIEHLLEDEMTQIVGASKISYNLEHVRSHLLLALQHDEDSPFSDAHDHPLSHHVQQVNSSVIEVERIVGVLSSVQLTQEELVAKQAFETVLRQVLQSGVTPTLSSLQQEDYFLANQQLLEVLNPQVDQLQTLLNNFIEISIAEGQQSYIESRTLAREFFIMLSVVMVLCSVGLVVIAYITIRRFVFAIERLDRASEDIANGNLKSRVEIGGNDEFTTIAHSVNNIANRFEETVSLINHSAHQLSVASEQSSVVSQQTSENVITQQERIHMIASAVEEMTATVNDVASNAALAAEASKQSDEYATSGGQIVSEAVERSEHLAEEMRSAQAVINKLGQHSKDIGGILDVIRGISEQTNLLALNAAIEAARAGSHGRGFAVVADEVRTLAQRTNDSTQEIQVMIQRLQEGCTQAIDRMETGNDFAEQSVAKVQLAGSALEEITAAVARIAEMNLQIATAAEQQAVVTSEVNNNIASINEISEQTASGSTQSLQASKDISALTERLSKEVEKFVV
ncbi:methyl-accepting chemotaxis protein [Thaumasiovibrio sp. DFM-14]|uniref:methyl-accepting chemotaxis protein n=1 Tax=Thaumasiovibrio sp. DFM-14 TaxID=3384792 RepID=UPI0039A26508